MKSSKRLRRLLSCHLVRFTRETGAQQYGEDNYSFVSMCLVSVYLSVWFSAIVFNLIFNVLKLVQHGEVCTSIGAFIIQ